MFSTRPFHLASLGSSFAAGPGIPPRISRAARRSGQNYAHIVASHLNAKLTDLSVSGATLKNIISEPQTTTWPSNTFPPQIEGLSEDTDVVLLLGGGNDLGYVGGIISETLQMSFLGRILAWLLPPGKPVQLEAEDIKERFVEIIDLARKRAPRCKVLLVEYLTLFGGNTAPGVGVGLGWSEEGIEKYKVVAKNLSEGYRLAAKAREECCAVVGVAESSWDHDLGSEEPWVEGFNWGILWRRRAPYHPNAEGMEAVANMVLEELKRLGWD
ncbi:SGNH hydrolase [Stipitochalara longipes BDJ]|nr:SGNH hydrolase [Stipitochalara longipes BDJ]